MNAPAFHLFESRHEAESKLARHRHTEPYLCIVLAGSFREEFTGGAVSAHSGMVIVHPPGDQHADLFDHEGAHCLNVTPSATWLAKAMAQTPFAHYSALELSGALFAARRMLNELQAPDPISPLAVEAAVLDLLVNFTRRARPFLFERNWIGTIKTLIDANPCETWRLTDLGERVGHHPAHVARAFREAYGEALGAYARRRRIERCRELLEAGQYSVVDVAMLAGFHDQSHFTRVFRRQFGFTPGQLR